MSGSINHSTGSLLLRNLGLICHLIQITIEGAEFIFKLPLSSSKGLVLVGQISKGFIAVSQLLLKGPACTVGLLKHGTRLFKSISHGTSLPFSIDLGILSLSLALRFSFKGSLHGVKGLRLILLDGKEFLLLLIETALNLLPHLSELKLSTENLIFLLFKGSLSLLKGSLELKLLSLKAPM